MENTFTVWTLVGAVCVAAIFILVFSQVREPYRQRINALLIAGAGAVYWSGGFGAGGFLQKQTILPGIGRRRLPTSKWL